MEDFVQWPKNFKKASIRLSNGEKLSGKINIKDFQRLSDLMRNSEEQYIILIGCENGGIENKTYIINKKFIIWLDAGPGNNGEEACI